jgi:hypothetical protein
LIRGNKIGPVELLRSEKGHYIWLVVKVRRKSNILLTARTGEVGPLEFRVLESKETDGGAESEHAEVEAAEDQAEENVAGHQPDAGRGHD